MHQTTTIPGTLVAASWKLGHLAGRGRMSLLSAARHSPRLPPDPTAPRTPPTTPTPTPQ